MHSLARVGTLMLLSSTIAAHASATDIFVDARDGDDVNNGGTGWNDAYKTLQVAINAASVNDNILVAEGVYGPWQSGGSYIVLANEMDIYGGYLGDTTGSSTPGAPDGSFLQTKIRGKTLTDDTEPVVRAVNGFDILLRGFVIEEGDCGLEDTTWGGNGGGFYCTSAELVRLEHVTLRNNDADRYGGAIYVAEGGVFSVNNVSCELEIDALEVDRCTIYGNTATRGGGVYVGEEHAQTAVALGNTVFYENVATGSFSFAEDGGGAIYIDRESFVLATNCLIHNNSADAGGGIFIRPDEHPETAPDICVLRHCTISLNDCDAYNGGGIHAQGSGDGAGCERIDVFNSIVWGNTAPQGLANPYDMYYAGGGAPFVVVASDYGTQSGVNVSAGSNLGNTDPEFTNAAAADFTLDTGAPSPCIDAALDSELGDDITDLDEDTLKTDSLTKDLTMDRRIEGDHADMGAYESGH